jgi:vacuolar-type H+-ATPase subunit I/STV1
MSYLEEYALKLNVLPEEANKRLRKIRELDRKVDAIQKEIDTKQKELIEKVAQIKWKKDVKQREYLEKFYKDIVVLHKECHDVSQ